ncbi:MAG: AMP-dependent synthetase [Nocardia sp.]|uniref:AMP-dependent synthetase/ligase n=1 Tax=Nocardia sp. TaxID=1821 RepID=UPI002603FC79|nr:long-chain fatty acid--CoA ligase [Nocardia sp.]MCU1639866.1 AMP-dependent synthetase [Nocardia sp.]
MSGRFEVEETTGPSTPRTLCEAFQQNVTRYADRVALRTPGDLVRVTWRAYGEQVRSVAAGLAGLGVRPGDTVALMLTNRPEFHVCDTAVLHAGATPFSMYNTNPPEMLAYLFGNAENRVVICEKQFVPAVLAAAALGGKVEHVICVDGEPEGTIGLAAVEAAPATDFDFDATWRAVAAGDVLTIVYTSGTTGMPKGVELTHANFMANAQLIDELGSCGPGDRVVSYLPDAHAANRWIAHYANLLRGVQITTVADRKQVLEALSDARPTLFVGVPQMWMKVKAALEGSVAAESSPIKRALAGWGLSTGRERARRSTDRLPISPALQAQYLVADKLVLSKVREKLGLDQVRIGVSGAAPIPPEVHRFMLGLGITVCEAWGMSELTAAATVNRPDDIRVGTVGRAVPGAEIKVAADGELLVRGPMLMKGYRNDPEKTAEAIDSEGWMHTGDIGTIDADGFVKIVDRKKELIINSSGKNMSPTHIENAVAVACPLIGSVIAIGDQRPYIVALVALDPEAIAAFAGKHGLPTTSVAELHSHPQVVAEVAAGITAANSTLARVEQIKNYTILPDIWEPGSDTVTPTMKLKRKPIVARYATEIDKLYGEKA